MVTDRYTGRELFQLLLEGGDAGAAVRDWYEEGIATDLRIRRAKTKGCVVVETKDVLFANRLLRWFPNVKVNVKK